MDLYLMVNKLKPEGIKDYSEYHEEAHNTKWKSQIIAIKKAGFEICNVYVYDDLSIVLLGCDDLDACLTKLGKDEDNNEWQALMNTFFEADPKFDGTETVTVKKVFDLNAQAALIRD